MTIIRRLTTATAAVALAAGLTACTSAAVEDQAHASAPTGVVDAAPESLCDVGTCDTVTVDRPIDGDTIDVTTAGGDVERVRVLGVDTPETKHPTKPVECFGPEASQATAELAPAGTTVTLVTDDQADAADKYDRLLRHVVLGPDGEGTNLGQQLLADGLAHTTTFPHSLHAEYTAAESEARAADTGLWGQC